MDIEELERALAAQFPADEGERRAVVRQARDLADAGRYERDVDAPLTPETIVRNLADAPDPGLAERWNWWLGALEVAYGGYAEFQVRRFRREPDRGEEDDNTGGRNTS